MFSDSSLDHASRPGHDVRVTTRPGAPGPSTDSPSAHARCFGKHHVIAQIGRGGMADVHLAVTRGALGFSRLVVVKTLRAELAHDPEMVTMFLEEARLAARLAHPNIVHVQEIGEQDGAYHLVMEHLDGQPLDRLIARCAERGAFDPAVALQIVADALRGLHHAHKLRDHGGEPLSVVHRDVSPQNLFVTYAGVVKVVDFGIAKSDDSVVETRSGLFKGKVAYMAPEQAVGEPVDRRADVFACGAVLFELLVGRRMWEGMPEAVIASKLVRGAIPRLATLRPDLPPRLAHIVDRATAPRREDRYPSAEAMLIDVEDALAAHDPRRSGRELARLTCELFATERAELDRFVATQLAMLERGELPATRTSTMPITFGTPSRESDVAHTRIAPLGDEDVSSAETVPGGRAWARPRVRRARPVLIWPRYAAVGALLVGLVTVAALHTPSETPTARAGSAPRRLEAAPTIDGCAGEGASVVAMAGDIDEDATLTCDKVYRLEHVVVVRAGVTLTIQPGTRIVGDAESDGTLLVEPGGKLHAIGTRTQPIVFTSERSADARAPGDWGGVILLGSAPTNVHDRAGRPRRGQVEGILERGVYGGDLPDDDSGTMRYVRIEYGGTRLGPNNEINGLTLAGVGRGTQIDHVQVRHTKDDCFELFGGTVDLHHVICDAPGDDGFDWDQGYTGRMQFLLLRDDASADGNHGFEGDNDPDSAAAAPISAPVIANVTLCGAGGSRESYALLLRHGTRGRITNLVASGFRALVDVRDRHAGFEVGPFAVVGASLPVALVEGDAPGLPADDDFGFDELGWLSGRAVSSSSGDGACGHVTPDDVDGTTPAPQDDAFFDGGARFLGAFRDGEDRWHEAPWVAAFP